MSSANLADSTTELSQPDDNQSAGTPTNPSEPPVNNNSPFSKNYSPESLTWESSKSPERKLWSNELYKLIAAKWDLLKNAKDLDYFCSKADKLTKDQKINLWANIIATMTKYESGYNPKSYSVDVGTKNNKDTWSVGLLQLSVVDQKSYKFNFGYQFADLQDPIKNLKLGISIMARQVGKYGKVLIAKGESGLYWAVIHPGGKYDQSQAIRDYTRRHSYCQ